MKENKHGVIDGIQTQKRKLKYLDINLSHCMNFPPQIQLWPSLKIHELLMTIPTNSVLSFLHMSEEMS
jgi:hypothetical protein